ncbi:MAG: rhodanese-like domain-containing protein [Alkalicoccus sp.]|nr:MAG: rhodanese-like domain-containing protein [Alkalicoccus sp.]
MKIWTAEEVNSRLNNSLQMVDVRESEETVQGMVPGAKHIPLGEIPQRLEEIDKSKEVIMICRSGARSERAGQFLEKQGYNVINMDGGMISWNGETAAP